MTSANGRGGFVSTSSSKISSRRGWSAAISVLASPSRLSTANLSTWSAQNRIAYSSSTIARGTSMRPRGSDFKSRSSVPMSQSTEESRTTLPFPCFSGCSRGAGRSSQWPGASDSSFLARRREPKRLVDLARGLGEVERVEVEAGHARLEKIAAELRGHVDAALTDLGAIVATRLDPANDVV